MFKLKSKLIIAVMVMFGITAFMSCEKDSDISNVETNNLYRKKVTDINIITSFKEKINNLKSNSKITFDTDNIYEVGLTESSNKVLVADQIGFDVDNQINYGLSMALNDKGECSVPLIIETQNINADDKIINYYDATNNLLLSIELDNNTKSINVLFKAQTQLKSGGQYVVDCLSDAYSNHGWISVWAIVQSAFIPETAAALAADCYLHYLFE